MAPRQRARPLWGNPNSFLWIWVNAALLVVLSEAPSSTGQQTLGRAKQFEQQERFHEYDVIYVLMDPNRDLSLPSGPPALDATTFWRAEYKTSCMSDLQLSTILEMADPYSRIHILTDDDTRLHRTRRLAALHPKGRLLVTDVTPFVPAVRDAFMRVYKHQSRWSRSYEGYCFWRWGMLSAYLEHVGQQGLNVSRIMVFDADVVPTLPFDQWLTPEQDEDFGKGTHLIMYAPGAATLWSLQFFMGYFPFIMDLYANSSKTEEFVRAYRDHIDENPDCKAGAAEVIPCGSVRYQASDMSAIKAYMGLHRDKIYSPAYADTLHNMTGKQLDFWLGYIKENPCVAVAAVHKVLNGWTLVVEGGRSLQGSSDNSTPWYVMVPMSPRPTCFLHFQGFNKRNIARFCQFVKARVNGSVFML